MASENVVARMPLWFVFFIATSGLLVTLSFPFDILKADFENGIVLTNIIANVSKWLDQDFKPFVIVKHLGDSFPSGLIEIVLLSLVVGTLIYFLRPIYEQINERLMRTYCFLSHKDYERVRDSKETKEQIPVDKLRLFVRWSADVSRGHADFIASLQSLMEGLLLGAEIFLLLNFIRILFLFGRAIFTGQIELSSIGSEPALWFYTSVFLGILCYLLFRYFRTHFNKDFDDSVKMFKKAYKTKCAYMLFE